jgi:hypothetical protein
VPYLLLANLVVLAHVAFVAFALVGGLLALRWRWTAWLHLPAVAWGAFVEVTGRVCPLTPLENHLRRAAGVQSYEGDFVERYLLPLLYPAHLTRDWQLALGGILILVNVAIYVGVWRRWKYRNRDHRRFRD